MSQEISKDDEEIDFNKVFRTVRMFFRNILKLFLSVISFYTKKVFLFLGIIIIGGGIGYFVDKMIGTNDVMSQEIIVHPKYGTTSYFYELIADFQEKIGQEDFQKKIGISERSAKNVKKITLQPVLEIEDLVNNLYVKYGNKDFTGVVDYEEKDLEKKQFQNFYKKHRLVILFKKDIAENSEVAPIILDFIKSNSYYNEQLNFILTEAKESVEKDEKSLKFIDNYLENLAQNPDISKPDISKKEVYFFANENEIPTISSILRQKELLINKINSKKRILELEKELFPVIKFGVITPEHIPLYKKALVLVPATLCFLLSLWFFMMYINKSAKAFVAQEN